MSGEQDGWALELQPGALLVQRVGSTAILRSGLLAYVHRVVEAGPGSMLAPGDYVLLRGRTSTATHLWMMMSDVRPPPVPVESFEHYRVVAASDVLAKAIPPDAPWMACAEHDRSKRHSAFEGHGRDLDPRADELRKALGLEEWCSWATLIANAEAGAKGLERARVAEAKLGRFHDAAKAGESITIEPDASISGGVTRPVVYESI